MDINKLFPSRFLKAADLDDQDVTMIVDRVTVEKLEDDQQKPAVHFRGQQKPLILNKTNSTVLAKHYGKDTR